MKNLNFAAAAIVALTAFAAAAPFDAADARPRAGRQGSVSRDVTVRGQNGGQRTVHDERSRNRRTGTATHDRTTTFNDGTTRTVEAERVRTGPGQYSATREVTGRNGETRTQSGDFTVTRTENGRVVTGDINTSHHGQIDTSREVSRENGVRSVNSQATFEDGTSITRASQGSCANGVCTSTGTVTNRQGGVSTWEQTRTRTENGAELSRDVTFADGTTRSVDAVREGNGDGTGTITRTVTDRDGQTRTQTGEYEVSRTPN